MGERKEKVSDSAAVEALKTIIAYCESNVCKHCVFNTINNICWFRYMDEAPAFWPVPKGYEK